MEPLGVYVGPGAPSWGLACIPSILPRSAQVTLVYPTDGIPGFSFFHGLGGRAWGKDTACWGKEDIVRIDRNGRFHLHLHFHFDNNLGVILCREHTPTTETEMS